MTIPRFYVPGPWTSDRITFPEISPRDARARMRNGDEAEVFDGEGRTARGRTEFSSEGTVLIAESYPRARTRVATLHYARAGLRVA